MVKVLVRGMEFKVKVVGTDAFAVAAKVRLL
jgi:hypothetical protein